MVRNSALVATFVFLSLLTYRLVGISNAAKIERS
jgi:hypothetical protein